MRKKTLTVDSIQNEEGKRKKDIKNKTLPKNEFEQGLKTLSDERKRSFLAFLHLLFSEETL